MPILTTTHLHIREFEPADLDALYAITSDPDAVRYTFTPSSEAGRRLRQFDSRVKSLKRTEKMAILAFLELYSQLVAYPYDAQVDRRAELQRILDYWKAQVD